ncbi:hypothetical protein BD324DRAFT_604668 [Kockovaella imperatae]|uniref:Pre-rRNA-processing protein RIX1 n=1 Tax=Kockovaella imperatae TaxID=4999 RepID=A0A1Y1U900_9TREE|nr:hypothetical protein BD324DRAFT_604668 [Kockovaella imperatae]ORX34482.1 hypothetical protein BD324DRAFT_604668 [Kockovaella imperatae]
MVINGDEAGPSDPLALLLSLPISHPSYSEILRRAPRPLTHSKTLAKIVNRLNTTLLVSTRNIIAADRTAAWAAVSELVEKAEDLVVDHGKGWLEAALAAISSLELPLSTLQQPMKLINILLTVSVRYPSFEREAVQPLMGKIALSLTRLLSRAANEQDLDSLSFSIEQTQRILMIYPAPFRPSISSLRALLRAIIFNCPIPPAPGSSTFGYPLNAPEDLIQISAELFAHLHLAVGKSQAPTVWAEDLKYARGIVDYAFSEYGRDAFTDNSAYASRIPHPSDLPPLPEDPAARSDAALHLLEGGVEVVVALLSVNSIRAVSVPLSSLIQTGVRCLTLSPTISVAGHVSPLHHAMLLGGLTRIWTAGLLICGSIMTACGDHLLPFLSSILEQSTSLLDQLPSAMSSSTAQILSFLHICFSLFPPALVPIEYPTRILKYCIARVGLLLESKSPSSIGPAANGSEGRRGKKRARGAEEGLIGSLEGRESKPISAQDVEVILGCLKLVPLLHGTPLLAPSITLLSIRLHLSIHLRLEMMTSSAFAAPGDLSRLTDTVAQVLEAAMMMVDNQAGTAKGWKTIIVSLLGQPHADKTSMLLHPHAPPTVRPQPPLSALHFFAPENEEEKKLRLELGLGRLEDEQREGDEDDTMEVCIVSEQQPNGQPTIERATVLSTISDSTLHLRPAEPAVAQPATTILQTVSKSDSDSANRQDQSTALEENGANEISLIKQVMEDGPARGDLVFPTVMDDEDEAFPELDSGSSDGMVSEGEE